MTIAEWLDRLNLYHYVPMFTKNQLYLITELKYHYDEKASNTLKKDKFKFKEPLEQMRIKQILSKDFAGLEDFKYLTEHSARQMLTKYIQNKDILEELITYIEPDSMTGFQLKDIIVKKYSPDDITDAIKERVELTKERAIASEDPRVVLDEAGDLEPGEVLICPFTDVGWTPYFSLASGLVTEIGGLLSHGAVVAREYGLPCVVNVENACSRFRTGMLVRVEGKTGTVTVM